MSLVLGAEAVAALLDHFRRHVHAPHLAAHLQQLPHRLGRGGEIRRGSLAHREHERARIQACGAEQTIELSHRIGTLEPLGADGDRDDRRRPDGGADRRRGVEGAFELAEGSRVVAHLPEGDSGGVAGPGSGAVEIASL